MHAAYNNVKDYHMHVLQKDRIPIALFADFVTIAISRYNTHNRVGFCCLSPYS